MIPVGITPPPDPSVVYLYYWYLNCFEKKSNDSQTRYSNSRKLQTSGCESTPKKKQQKNKGQKNNTCNAENFRIELMIFFVPSMNVTLPVRDACQNNTTILICCKSKLSKWTDTMTVLNSTTKLNYNLKPKGINPGWPPYTDNAYHTIPYNENSYHTNPYIKSLEKMIIIQFEVSTSGFSKNFRKNYSSWRKCLSYNFHILKLYGKHI